MTVSTTTVTNSASGNGSTAAFNYTFKIFADAEMVVIIRSAAGVETVKTISTHYTVSGAGSASGGAVTFTSGNIPASGETVVLRRATALTQATDYVENDPFPAASHEDALDKLTHVSQEQSDSLDRSLKISRTNSMTSTEFTTSASDRASKLLSFSSDGQSLEVTTGKVASVTVSASTVAPSAGAAGSATASTTFNTTTGALAFALGLPVGATGQMGGISMQYSTTTTDADPGAGFIRLNNTTLSSATLLYIDDSDGTNNIQPFVATWDDSSETNKGFLTIAGNPNTANPLVIFKVTGLTDASGYTKVNVTYVAGSTSISNNAEVSIAFSQTGSAASLAADDITAGDAASSFTTSSGNVTIDSQAGATTVDGHTGVTVQSSDSGNILLDSVADITLDAAGNDIELKAAGTQFGALTNSSSDFVIQSSVSDKDIIIKGNDGGSTVTALTIDMSEAGETTFSAGVKIGDDKKLSFGAAPDLTIEYDEDGADTTSVVAANGLSLAPFGTSSGNTTELRHYELAANGTNYAGFKAPDSITGTSIYTLPAAFPASNKILQSTSAGVLTWETAATATDPGLVFLSGATASSSATVVFTSGISSTYETYVITFNNVVPASDTVTFNMRTSTDGGSSYESSAGNYRYVCERGIQGGTGVTGSSSATEIILVAAGSGIGSDTGEGFNGIAYLYHPSNSGLYTSISSHGHYQDAAGDSLYYQSSGTRIAAADVDAIQFYFSSGNIESGEINLYGMAKS